MAIHIHPSVDKGLKLGAGNFAGGTLVCKCDDKPVKVGIKGDVAHNHACGCTKCWKPAGAVFFDCCCRAAWESHRVSQWRQTSCSRHVGDDPTACLQDLRDAHVWPYRE